MKRTAPLRRGNKRIPRIRPERRAQRDDYNQLRLEYLEEHPLCQIFIAEHGFDEEDVLRRFRSSGSRDYNGTRIPRATTIHHRNKCDGDRLVDRRWFMSACWEFHEMVESHKGWARELGYLLPIQADKDGRWGSGNQGLETPALMASRIGK